jgi:hypothetical protein
MTSNEQMEEMMKVWAQRQEAQLPIWNAWHEKFEAGKMTCLEFITGPDFSSVNLKEETRLLGVEMKLDGVKEPYEDRNNECQELRRTFLLDILKISPDEIVQPVEEDDLEKEVLSEDGEEDTLVTADPIALDEPDKFPGYAIWEGEETMLVFKDGDRIGSFTSSCRGNMYFVSAEAFGESYHASNKTHGKFE